MFHLQMHLELATYSCVFLCVCQIFRVCLISDASILKHLPTNYFLMFSFSQAVFTRSQRRVPEEMGITRKGKLRTSLISKHIV